MSQSSLTDAVRELEAAGMPVRRGVRVTHAKDIKDVDPTQFGSDLWFSRWTRNAFKNYPVVSRALGVRFLAEACKGLPAFVVGIGPSLDDQINHLKGLTNRAIIIATDAALRPLLANGITPDLCISYDCKDEQRLLWETVPKAPPCLFNSCAHPDSIASWPGPVLFYNQYHQQDELCRRILPIVFPEIGQLPSGGTVGTMGIFLAHCLGCDPVCAVGMDFCYKPADAGVVSWRYRAQDYRWVTDAGAGVPDHWDKTEIKELYDNDERLSRSYTVETEFGPRRTDPELAFYASTFSALMQKFKVPLMNCSPDGMIPKLRTDVQGNPTSAEFPALSLEDAVKKYCAAEFQRGRTTVHHLDKLAGNPRKP